MSAKRTHVDLYSGVGGFSLACQWAGVETIAFSEIDSYASRVLQRHWPNVRNYGDVRNFPRLSAWLLTAGVPCQPASVAGKRQGAADDRWLWPETLAVVENGSYEWLLFENVPGILSLNDGLEFECICAALEGQGYEVQPLIVPACGVGALHRRNRVWIVAHAIGQQLRGAGSGSITGTTGGVEGEERQQRIWADARERGADVFDAASTGSHAATLNRVHSEEESRRSWHAESERRSSSMANPNGRRREQCNASERRISESQPRCDVQNPEPTRLEGAERGELAQSREGRLDTDVAGSTWWSVEPDVGRLADGVSDRVGKLRCLGNAIVPQVAYQLIKRMIEAEQ